MSAINTDNAVNFFSNFAGASVNREDVVDALISNDDLEEVSINSDNIEDISSNEDDDSENNNDLLSNEDDDSENNNDLLSNEDDDSENNNDFSQNGDYNPSTQKMADGPEPFQPFDGEYGPYFANFTEQMLFLWVTKHMICK